MTGVGRLGRKAEEARCDLQCTPQLQIAEHEMAKAEDSGRSLGSALEIMFGRNCGRLRKPHILDAFRQKGRASRILDKLLPSEHSHSAWGHVIHNK